MLVRQNAALALGAIGPAAESAVPALSEALGDSEWAVRRQAAIALGEVGPAAKPARRPPANATRIRTSRSATRPRGAEEDWG